MPINLRGKAVGYRRHSQVPAASTVNAGIAKRIGIMVFGFFDRSIDSKVVTIAVTTVVAVLFHQRFGRGGYYTCSVALLIAVTLVKVHRELSLTLVTFVAIASTAVATDH
jgi:hypothetical protein